MTNQLKLHSEVSIYLQNPQKELKLKKNPKQPSVSSHTNTHYSVFRFKHCFQARNIFILCVNFYFQLLRCLASKLSAMGWVAGEGSRTLSGN